MSDSDFEISAISPNLYKKLKNGDITIEYLLSGRKELYEANESSFLGDLTNYIKGFFGKYFSRK